MITYLITGSIFGLAAGISPGPLLILVISETVKHGKISGIKVSLAPLITDGPVTILFILILSRFQNFNLLFGIIAILGGLYILYLSYGSFTLKKIELSTHSEKSKSFQKAILVNYLNPHIYIFWFTIGCPMILKAYNQNIISSIFFIVSFYFFIIGTKITIALLVVKFQDYIINNIFTAFSKILAFLLLIFSFWFIWEGIKYLKL